MIYRGFKNNDVFFDCRVTAHQDVIISLYRYIGCVVEFTCNEQCKYGMTWLTDHTFSAGAGNFFWLTGPKRKFITPDYPVVHVFYDTPDPEYCRVYTHTKIHSPSRVDEQRPADHNLIIDLHPDDAFRECLSVIRSR